jgi:hypothetical protein
MKERVWVICGNMTEYQNYVRSKPLNSDKKYFFVGGPDVLRGFVNPHGVFVGSWRYRKDIGDILHELNIRSSVTNPTVKKLLHELSSRPVPKTAMQVMEEAIQHQTLAMAKQMDIEVLNSLMHSGQTTKPISAKEFFDLM